MRDPKFKVMAASCGYFHGCVQKGGNLLFLFAGIFGAQDYLHLLQGLLVVRDGRNNGFLLPLKLEDFCANNRQPGLPTSNKLLGLLNPHPQRLEVPELALRLVEIAQEIGSYCIYPRIDLLRELLDGIIQRRDRNPHSLFRLLLLLVRLL